MYRVKDVSGDQWNIVDSADVTVFVGTKQQAEDWLDFQENARRQAFPASFSFSRLLHAMSLPLRRLATAHFSRKGLVPTSSRVQLPPVLRHARKH
jgi:hypothetical protein